MKTRYLVAIGLCLALLLLWYGWDSKLIPEKDNAASFVPRDALVFVEQKDIGELIDGFKESPLGKAVTAINVRQVATDIGLSDDEVAGLADTVKVIKDVGNSRLFREFCGKTAALALLPGGPVAAEVGQRVSLPFQALFIARPQHKAEIFELISSVATGNVHQSEVDYKGYKLKKFEIDGTTVYAATVDGFFLLGLQEKTLHTALDTALQADMSLVELPAFEQLRGQFSQPDFFAYTSLEGIRRELPAVTGQEAAGGAPDQFASLAGLQHSAYGIWREEGLLRDRSITLIDRQGLDPQVGKLLSAAPERNDTLRLVPEDILTYYWSNTFALSAIWQIYKENHKTDSQALNEFTGMFKKTTGSEVETVLALIEGGVSLFVNRGDDSAFIPLPHFAVFVKVTERRQMEDVIKKTTASFNIPLQEITYKDVTYTSYGQTLPGGLQALWGFHENYLFLANSRQILENIVDTREGGKGLQKSKVYTDLRMDLESDTNSVSFIRMAGVVDGIRELVGWGGVMLAIQGREAAAKSTALIDGVISPLLDGLTMFSTIATRSHLAEDRIVIESTFQLESETASGQGK